MKSYAVIQQSTNNNNVVSFTIVSEHGSDKEAAIIGFCQTCAALWNDASTKSAVLKVVDEKLDTVDGHIEFIRCTPFDEE